MPSGVERSMLVVVLDVAGAAVAAVGREAPVLPA
jgi:hypothetical protein